jgi:hypothetical protein
MLNISRGSVVSLILVSLLLLCGCMLDDVVPPPPPAAKLSPPQWIRGVWKDVLGYSSYTFTEDDVVYQLLERPGSAAQSPISYGSSFPQATDSLSGDRFPTYRVYSKPGDLFVTFVLFTEEEALFGMEYLQVRVHPMTDTINYYRE